MLNSFAQVCGVRRGCSPRKRTTTVQNELNPDMQEVLTMSDRQARKPGFTLIELLVVIAIIALLMAILVPVLSKVRKQAKSVECQANLRQQVLGMILYADDYDGAVITMGDKGMSVNELWFHKIAPYFGDREYAQDPSLHEGVMDIIKCPVAFKVSTTNAFGSGNFGTAERAWRGYHGGQASYSVNQWIVRSEFYDGLSAEEQGWHYKKLMEAKQETPVFGDGVWVGMWPHHTDDPPNLCGGTFLDPWRAGAQMTAMGCFCLDRHGMAINMGFVGGHVDKVKLADLWTLPWHKAFEPRYDMEEILRQKPRTRF